MNADFEDAWRILARARKTLFFTGAGVSAESGVPTFRDAGGLWEGVRPEEVATPEGFAKDPARVWRFYLARRAQAALVKPNPAHLAIARYEREGRGREVVVATQNIDGLHQAAGSGVVYEIHGSLFRTKCVACGRAFEDRRAEYEEIPPRCACGGVLRPAVVWFGEVLPAAPLAASTQAAETCDVCVVVGTSATVYPAAAIPFAARAAGARLVVVNAEPTALAAAADVFLQGKAGEVLPRILACGAGR